MCFDKVVNLGEVRDFIAVYNKVLLYQLP